MKPTKRIHLTATIFPANTLQDVRRASQGGASSKSEEIVFLAGTSRRPGRRVKLIAEEFAKAGKAIRIVQTL
ncbi:MAG: hypothetical protein QM753_06040 [Thermomicrobiales bacterium]